jgi:hypothetical protein
VPVPPVYAFCAVACAFSRNAAAVADLPADGAPCAHTPCSQRVELASQLGYPAPQTPDTSPREAGAGVEVSASACYPPPRRQ